MQAFSSLALVALFVLAGCSTPPTVVAPTTPASSLVSFSGTGNVVGTPEALSGLHFTTHSTGTRGGEPSIGVSPKGNIFVTAGNLVLRSANGENWTTAFNLTQFWGPAYDPDPQHQVRGITRSSDDMLWVDPDTGRVFADFMTGLYCSKLFISDDEGATWTPSPNDCGIPLNDHQKMSTSHYGPAVPAPANPAYPNLVWYCYNKLVSTDCAVSLDGGLTFSYDRPATFAVTASGGVPAAMGACGGINGVPASGPDGTVYVPITLGCPGPVVMVTKDNGLTWTEHDGPTTHGAEELDPVVATTPDGTSYMLYRGSDHLQYLARSTDGFATWQGPWRVTIPGIKSSVFAGLTAGDNGRIAMAFLATRDTAKEPSLAPPDTHWYLYEVESIDAAAANPTFTSAQVSPDLNPVQIGCVWLNGGSNPCRNLLDFIDMTKDLQGRPIVVYTNGCKAGCAGNVSATNATSRSRNVEVSILDGGPALFANGAHGNGAHGAGALPTMLGVPGTGAALRAPRPGQAKYPARTG
ncbi:MAG: sialidase family protein [Thermoplasmatota archaeon]